MGIENSMKMIFAFLLLISAAFCSGCKDGENNDGWICYGRGWYKLYTSRYRRSWYSANDFCKSKRAVLASIHSSDENNFVGGLIRAAIGRGSAWIGAKRGRRGTQFYWSNSANKRVTFEDWNRGQPNGDRRRVNCVNIFASGRTHGWFDDDCNTARAFVCESQRDH